MLPPLLVTGAAPKVRLELTASGTVTDVSEADRLAVASTIAAVLGVRTTAVVVTVLPASVLIVVEVEFDTTTQRDEGRTELARVITSSDDATALLTGSGLTILQPPMITAVDKADSAKPPPGPGVASESDGSGMVLVGGAAAATLVLLAGAIVRRHRQSAVQEGQLQEARATIAAQVAQLQEAKATIAALEKKAVTPAQSGKSDQGLSEAQRNSPREGPQRTALEKKAVTPAQSVKSDQGLSEALRNSPREGPQRTHHCPALPVSVPLPQPLELAAESHRPRLRRSSTVQSMRKESLSRASREAPPSSRSSRKRLLCLPGGCKCVTPLAAAGSSHATLQSTKDGPAGHEGVVSTRSRDLGGLPVRV